MLRKKSRYLFVSPLDEDLKPEIMEKIGGMWFKHHDNSDPQRDRYKELRRKSDVLSNNVRNRINRWDAVKSKINDKINAQRKVDNNEYGDNYNRRNARLTDILIKLKNKYPESYSDMNSSHFNTDRRNELKKFKMNSPNNSKDLIDDLKYFNNSKDKPMMVMQNIKNKLLPANMKYIDKAKNTMSNIDKHSSNIDNAAVKKYGIQSRPGNVSRPTDDYMTTAMDKRQIYKTHHQRRNELSLAASDLLGDYLNSKPGHWHTPGTSTHAPHKDSLMNYENRKKFYEQRRQNGAHNFDNFRG